MSLRGGSSAGYGLNSGPNPYGSSSHEEESGILDQIRPYTSKVEDFLETMSEPIKP